MLGKVARALKEDTACSTTEYTCGVMDEQARLHL